MSELTEAIAVLNRFAYARDRRTETEPRTVTITDDQAAALLDALNQR